MIIKTKWILSLGILAMVPGTTMAGPFNKKPAPTPVAAATEAQSVKTNEQVAQEIANALRAAKLTGYDIEIEYINGKATITGMVGDARQKTIAEQMARSVREVTVVENRLGIIAAGQGQVQQVNHQEFAPGVQTAGFQSNGSTIASPIQKVDFSNAALPADASVASNQQMAEQIAGALQQSGINGYDIEIRYENGTAGLYGNVGTPEQRFLAERAVSGIQGVGRVDNQLQVPQQQMAGLPPGAGVQAQNASYGQMGMPAGAPYGQATPTSTVYNQPNMPNYSWPTYAAYPNAAAVTYPKQYSASAFPYVGPFYPYPQVPRGWRRASLEWDDGSWQLEFDNKTDRWWWFVNPKNW